MAIMTYGLKAHKNQFQADSLIALAERLVHGGDTLTALKCIITAADIAFELPGNSAVMGAKIALNVCRTNPEFEAIRIAGCLGRLAHDVGYKNATDEEVFLLFEMVLQRWRVNNVVPFTHLVLKAKDRITYLLELRWNDGFDSHDPFPANSREKERILAFLTKKPKYFVELSTSKGSRPCYIGPMLLTDEDVLKALHEFSNYGITYYSPRMRSVVLEIAKESGQENILWESHNLPVSMSWYARKMARKSGRLVKKDEVFREDWPRRKYSYKYL